MSFLPIPNTWWKSCKPMGLHPNKNQWVVKTMGCSSSALRWVFEPLNQLPFGVASMFFSAIYLSLFFFCPVRRFQAHNSFTLKIQKNELETCIALYSIYQVIEANSKVTLFAGEFSRLLLLNFLSSIPLINHII